MNKEKSEGRTVYPAKTKVKGANLILGWFSFKLLMCTWKGIKDNYEHN